jgi:hypothetical protein
VLGLHSGGVNDRSRSRNPYDSGEAAPVLARGSDWAEGGGRNEAKPIADSPFSGCMPESNG